MNFLRWTPDRNARLCTILALIVILLIFGVAVIYSPDFQWRNANSGFGPDWECTPHALSEPTCIKKLQR
jgi:hypothetical protein